MQVDKINREKIYPSASHKRVWGSRRIAQPQRWMEVNG